MTLDGERALVHSEHRRGMEYRCGWKKRREEERSATKEKPKERERATQRSERSKFTVNIKDEKDTNMQRLCSTESMHVVPHPKCTVPFVSTLSKSCHPTVGGPRRKTTTASTGLTRSSNRHRRASTWSDKRKAKSMATLSVLPHPPCFLTLTILSVRGVNVSSPRGTIFLVFYELQTFIYIYVNSASKEFHSPAVP